MNITNLTNITTNQGYELYKRGYGGGQGAAVEGKWKEGHVPDTSLVMQLVRLTLELVGDSCSLAVRGATPVTLCSHYCTGEGCNSASLLSPPTPLLLLLSLLVITFILPL